MKTLTNLFIIFIFTASVAFAQFTIDVESGAVFSGYNDVRIPGDTGTRFSLSEELKIDPSIFWRAKLGYDFNERHHLSILLAPLSLESAGQLNRDLDFQGTVFPAATPLRATYRFNSFRLTYRYDFLLKEKVELGVGFTAKIRDAEISVRANDVEAKKMNVGFVPIINFKLLWKFAEQFGLLVEGDALAAPQGRAEDVLLALQYQVSDQIGLKLGYRLLEGGADNDVVYNFALLNYAALGATIHF